MHDPVKLADAISHYAWSHIQALTSCASVSSGTSVEVKFSEFTWRNSPGQVSPAPRLSAFYIFSGLGFGVEEEMYLILRGHLVKHGKQFFVSHKT